MANNRQKLKVKKEENKIVNTEAVTSLMIANKNEVQFINEYLLLQIMITNQMLFYNQWVIIDPKDL